MAELGASVQRLSERLSKIERRVQNATGRKKIAKEVPNTVDEISKLILDVVNRYGWPPTWQQRYSTMIEQIIPTTENLYDPEEDRADMLAAIVLNPDVADADLEAEFLSYYGG